MECLIQQQSHFKVALYHMGERKEKSIETALNLKELQLYPLYPQN
jgi:hypothetical protein